MTKPFIKANTASTNENKVSESVIVLISAKEVKIIMLKKNPKNLTGNMILFLPKNLAV